jgi:hypothetical protein
VTSVQGGIESVTLAVARAGGFTGTVTLEVTGLPSGVGVTLSTIQLAGGATGASASLAVGGTVPAGTYTVAVRARATGLTDATTSFSLVVVSAYAMASSSYATVMGTTQSTTIPRTRAMDTRGP